VFRSCRAPIALFLLCLLAGPLPAADPKIDLAVLYAGSVDSARTDDFVALLARHFRRVGTTAYTTFRSEEAHGWDVVLLDCEIHPTAETIGLEKQPSLPVAYDRPTVLIGGGGAMVGDRLGLKLDWL
jgi:hypothetical protein